MIEDVVKSKEFKERYGDGLTYDDMRGFVGWKGRREEDDCPQSKLRSKGINEFASNSDWVSHFQKFGTKVQNEKKCEKKIIWTLGLQSFPK